MKLLLDTHTLIWFLEDNENLSPRAKKAIETNLDTVYISIVSLWEIAIKINLNKLKLEIPFDDLVDIELSANKLELLPILPTHTKVLLTLPLHHRDPFDRMLIAQAKSERLLLVSADNALDQYAIDRYW
jgi:PIN domain nuclease of toxin-antitoxin system